MSEACGNSLTDDASVSDQQPSEVECWAAFWERIAEAWAAMPVEVQQQCLDEQAELEQQLLSA